MILSYTADAGDSGKTVKHILKNKMKLSENLVKKLKYSGNILCNATPVHINVPVSPGDLIEAVLDFSGEDTGVVPEKCLLDIIYEDECLIAVNKGPHMVVHPSPGHPSGTLANGIMHHLEEKGEARKVRPISRLDKDTSGIILFAKNQYVQEHLIRQMGSTFTKEYIGIVYGSIEEDSGIIDLPIMRKPGSIIERQVSPSGLKAVTHYFVIERLNGASYLKFHLETGRTHQIRVHCQAIGHPLLGDTLYGSPSGVPCNSRQTIIERQALHSLRVSFIHPVTEKLFELSAPIPADISSLLEITRK